MPTPAERHALVFLAAVALVGGGVRLVGVQRFERDVARATVPVDGGATTELGRQQLQAQIEAVDSVRRKRTRRAARSSHPRTAGRSSPGGPLPTLDHGPSRPSPDNPLNVNDATQEDLERLPRVGPALALRILARRDSLGPFGSMDDLRHVRGIGTATASLLAPLVTFDRGYRPIQNGNPIRPDTSVRLLLISAESPWLHRQ